MVKASEALGRQVVTRRGGREIGEVEDLIIDQAGQEVAGLVLRRHALRGQRVVRWSNVQAFGPHRVIIDTRRSLVRISKEPEIKTMLRRSTRVKGLRLVTTQGQKLGRIDDLSFDDTSGEITGYELKSRTLAEVTNGTPFLPTPKWIEFGRKFAFVIPESVASIRSSLLMT
jgi:uncharacterized protein YrrD